MDYISDPLWQRIRDFSFDESGALLPFSKKLSQEQNWYEDFTNAAIAEYRKFMYLCCISPNGASPSKIIDEVWHLHLTYTVNYWIQFCKETLHKEIHHHPSQGGENEKIKHADWYAATLDLYVETFKEEPPEPIWPKPTPRFLPVSNLTETIATKTTDGKWFLLLLLPFLLITVAYGQPIPLNYPENIILFSS